MAVNTTKLYYNTGFNLNNIPDSPTLLNSCFSRDLEGHWDYQDYFLNSLKLKVNWNTVKNADYLKYGTAYYFITGISMLNENTAELSLELDALTSMGGANSQNYVEGIITQAHAIDDTLFSNICEEPIGCREELKLSDLGKIGDTGTNTTFNILVSPVALNIADPLATAESISFYDEEGNVSVSIPKCPPKSPTTTIGVELPDSTPTYDAKPLGYYKYGTDEDNELLNKNLDYLRSLGLESAVLYSYSIPTEYIANHSDIGPYIESMTGNLIEGTQAGANIANGYSNIKNNKTYAMYNSFIVRSNTSGDMKEFQAHELWDSINFTSLTSTINFNIVADPQYGGRPYCFPKYYLGERMKNPTYQSVAGLQWYDLPIVYTSASGSQFAYNEYQLNKGGIKTSALKKPTTGLAYNVKGFGDTAMKLLQEGKLSNGQSLVRDFAIIPGALSEGFMSSNGGLSTISGLNKLNYNLANAEAEYEQSQVVAPELSSTPAMGLQRFIKNDFELYRMRPSDNDIQAIDKYFTMYGYTQPNITFDKAYLSGRQYFNYIKCSGVKISRGTASDPYGLGVKSKAEQQLNAGVRIWHTLPQVVNSNPIV